MRASAFPPPYQGQRDDVPLAALQPPYAQYATNFNLHTGVPTLRRGESVWSATAGSPTEYFYHLATSNASAAPLFGVAKLFAVVASGLSNYTYDVSATGAPALSDTWGTGASFTAASINFNNYLFLFDGAGTNRAWNGAAWGAAGYTFPTITTPFGGEVYKNRVYILGVASTKYAYGGIDAISGATTEVDLASILSRPAYLYGIKSISLSQGIQQENVLAFIFSSGEILVYSGTYPGGTWGLIGRFIVANPLEYHPFIDAKGDSFVITRTGLISLRTLFSQGADLATTQSISLPLTNRWRVPIFNAIGATGQGIKGIYDILYDRLIIQIWRTTNHSDAVVANSCQRFIYNFRTESWQEAWTSMGTGVTGFSGGLAYFDDRVFYTTYGYRGVIKMEGATNFVDASVNAGTAQGYPYQLRTAPLYSENFGVNTCTGVELLSKTDLDAQTNYTLVSNLGLITSDNQKIASQGTGVQNPFIDIGIDANYLQLDISGTTTSGSTLGFELNAINLWSEPGGVR